MLLIQYAWARVAPCHQAYDLLHPLRRCRSALAQGEWNYESLRETLATKKEEHKASGTLAHLSIYFQDLDHGPRFGIGEYDKFQAVSLIKLPVAIFFLHAADLNPAILDKTLSFSGELAIRDNVSSPEETLLPDTPYPIREMIRKMIVYSDNRSYLLLLREMGILSEDVAYRTFHDLDVLQMMLESDVTYVSIASYAKLYSVLYNTGYLSKDMSQLALRMLSESTFPGGIVAGVPKGTRVAHKFGYATIAGETHLHDCGIVYHPKMAYTLCIMTTGYDDDASNAAITDISKIVYDTVSTLDVDHISDENLFLP
jgi:beta-lactamase class A